MIGGTLPCGPFARDKADPLGWKDDRGATHHFSEETMKRKMEHKKGTQLSKMPHGPTPPGKPMPAARAQHVARAKKLNGVKI